TRSRTRSNDAASNVETMKRSSVTCTSKESTEKAQTWPWIIWTSAVSTTDSAMSFCAENQRGWKMTGLKLPRRTTVTASILISASAIVAAQYTPGRALGPSTFLGTTAHVERPGV